MNKHKKFLTVSFFFAILLNFAFNTPVFSEDKPNIPIIPSGFQLVLADLGTRLYRKDYAEGNPDFVQIIDLSHGAALHLLYGPISKKGKGKGVYGGDNPEFESYALQKFWADFSSIEPDAFCVTNGQFFFIQKYPYKLAYPMKVRGDILTDGFENKFYPKEKLLLEIWENRVDIRKASKVEFYSSTAPNIVGGLTEIANRKSKFHVGRTFIGIDDNNQDGVFETILIFNTLSARQIDAANTLRAFGADKVMMLDGGGSTQLICHDKWYVESERLIPQAIGSSAAPGFPYAANISTSPPTSIISASESYSLTISAQNVGHNKWMQKFDRISLSIPKNSFIINDSFTEDIEPGDKAIFVWQIPSFQEWGIYEASISIDRESQPLPNSQQVIIFYVIPDNLSTRKQEFLDLLEREKIAGTQKTSKLFTEWVLSKTNDKPNTTSLNQEPQSAISLENFNYKNILYIPIIMLPFLVVILIIIDMHRTK